MRLVFCGFALLTQCATMAGQLPVNPYGRVLTGEGVEVEIADFTLKHNGGLRDALIRFKGAKAYDDGIDGEVHWYAATPINGKTYFVSLRDGRIRLVTAKDRFNGSDSTKAFLDKKVIGLWANLKESKGLQSKSLVSDLKGSPGDVSSIQQARSAAEADIKFQTEQVKKACGNKNLTVKVNWSEYSKLTAYAESENRIIPELMRLASGHVGQVMSELKALCSDKDYKGEIVKLNEVQLSPTQSEDKLFTIKKAGPRLELKANASRFDTNSRVADMLSGVF